MFEKDTPFSLSETEDKGTKGQLLTNIKKKLTKTITSSPKQDLQEQ